MALITRGRAGKAMDLSTTCWPMRSRRSPEVTHENPFATG